MAHDRQPEIVGCDAPCRFGVSRRPVRIFHDAARYLNDRHRALQLGAVAFFLCVSAFAADQPPALFTDSAAGLRLRKPVTTFKELKERRVVKQRYDYSCGAAALATLLQHYYKLPVTEEGIVAYIIHKRGEEEAIRRYKEKKGFSLLDLKMAASSIAFRCAAYSEMTLADLLELQTPVIVPIRTRQYDHFVVFRGLRDDRVYLTDPVSGNLTMKATNFQSVWKDGVGLVLKSRKGLQPTDWQPEHNAQGFYVSPDQARSLIQSTTVGVRRGPREF
jgi:predicted double-glycine peptidase